MKNAVWWLTVVLLVAGSGAGLYILWQQERQPASRLADSGVSTRPEVKVKQPGEGKREIRHPVERIQLAPAEQNESKTREPDVQEESLPSLDQSDDAIWTSLEESLDRESLARLVFARNLVRRVVSTVDNLARDKVSLKVRALKPVAGQFLVTGKAGGYALDPANSARYGTYVALAESVDIGILVATYVHFYPLFQQAYLDLGYPAGYFNDRLIEVIDNLLAAPAVQEPIKLVRPHVLYRFADPRLEALSAGQKMLVRMGSENAERVKARLRAIRKHLTVPVEEAPTSSPR